MKRERRWAATSNRTYDPADDRRGVLATLALIGALVVLSGLMFAASPGGSSRDTSQWGSAGDETGAPSSETPAGPQDLSFLCETSGYPPVDLSVGQKDRLQQATERFVLGAYGDPGSDPEAYERRLRKLVVPECFWQSQAGGYAEGIEEVARAGEAAPPSSEVFAKELATFDYQGASRVTDPESGAEYVKAEVIAVWVSRKADGELVGKQQSLRFAKEAGSGGAWEVIGDSPS